MLYDHVYQYVWMNWHHGHPMLPFNMALSSALKVPLPGYLYPSLPGFLAAVNHARMTPPAQSKRAPGDQPDCPVQVLSIVARFGALKSFVFPTKSNIAREILGDI